MRQLELPARGRGGRRPGAGRPKKRGAGVSHLRRPAFARPVPLHVTLTIRDDVGSLRVHKRFRRIQGAFFYGGARFGIRLAQFSVQGNHIHLILEARDRRSLSRGIQGLAIRVARALNRVSARTGAVFADRYHARILATPTDTRNAVHYVLHNRQHHERRLGRAVHPWYIDPFSSASGEACWYFDERSGYSAAIVLAPETWLLRRATAPP